MAHLISLESSIGISFFTGCDNSDLLYGFHELILSSCLFYAKNSAADLFHDFILQNFALNHYEWAADGMEIICFFPFRQPIICQLMFNFSIGITQPNRTGDDVKSGLRVAVNMRGVINVQYISC